MATSQSDVDPATIPSREPAEVVPGELMQVSRAMGTIYKEQFGRGPRVAHSHYAGRDIIICVLEGTLTAVEQSLVRLGEVRELQNIRQLFQNATEETFRTAVEKITGRKVVSFMSANDIEGDTASEIFIFERSLESRANAG